MQLSIRPSGVSIADVLAVARLDAHVTLAPQSVTALSLRLG